MSAPDLQALRRLVTAVVTLRKSRTPDAVEDLIEACGVLVEAELEAHPWALAWSLDAEDLLSSAAMRHAEDLVAQWGPATVRDGSPFPDDAELSGLRLRKDPEGPTYGVHFENGLLAALVVPRRTANPDRRRKLADDLAAVGYALARVGKAGDDVITDHDADRIILLGGYLVGSSFRLRAGEHGLFHDLRFAPRAEVSSIVPLLTRWKARIEEQQARGRIARQQGGREHAIAADRAERAIMSCWYDLTEAGADLKAALERELTERFGDDRTAALRYLRGASLQDLEEVLREARVCTGWVLFDEMDRIIDDDAQEPYSAAELYLVSDDVVARLDRVDRVWHCLLDKAGTTEHLGPFRDLSVGQQAAELDLIASGYHVPWRKAADT